ncbi:glycosyltransferase [Streptosporangium sp. NPDC051022]|uniref:glycosyltransferase n=1 Tax=Streptosporangium sp. NPDC051022 TaxID=3155752 RepID=UPI00342E67C0
MSRDTVLFLTHHLPWPILSGGRRREAELLVRLAPRYDIEVVAVSKVPHTDRAGIAEAERAGLRVRLFAAEPADHPFRSPLVRQHSSAPARRYLRHRLTPPHAPIVHVEGHYLMPLVPARARAGALLVEHNVESTLLRQHADAAGGGLPRYRRLAHVSLTERAELNAWRQVRLVGALSGEDAAIMRRRAPRVSVHMLPSGADHLPAPRPAGGLPSPDLLFVANFGYPPSLDGARLLVSHIFPRVVERHPRATLAIVGADPPGWLLAHRDRDPRITLPGWVDDLAAWLATAKLVLCPLRIGGGIKIKVLEALAAGKCVVTTSVGAQGFDEPTRRAFVVRDDADSFAGAVADLLDRAELRSLHEDRARTAAASLPSWEQAAHSLAECWRVLSGPE